MTASSALTKTGNVLEYGVFSSEQIKSAEAATYDDNGNLIPLSERFDTGKKDIRYSLSEDLENYTPRGSQLEQNQLNALFRLAQENKESVDRRKNAMREANRQLTELNDMFEGISKDWDYHRGTAAARRGIARAQKEYDR